MLTSDKDLHCNLYFNSQFTNCFIIWLALLGNQVQYYVSKHGISKLFFRKRFFLVRSLMGFDVHFHRQCYKTIGLFFSLCYQVMVCAGSLDSTQEA